MVKLFTHTDLDGVSCAILAHLAYGNELDIEYCEPNTINESVTVFLENEYKKYQKVYITDLSIHQELASKIELSIHTEPSFPKMFLIDHHKTALNLNRYSWCNVQVYLSDKRLACAAYLVFEHLITSSFLSKNIEFFVEKVRRLDTWDWERKYNDILAKQLNDLLHILGRERFIQKYTKFISIREETLFDDTDRLLLQLEQEKIKSYIELKQKQILMKQINQYKVGVVFAEQYRSELGNQLAKGNPTLDFVVLINPAESISFRGIKEDIDLSEIAQVFGGGGHKMASGSPVNTKLKNTLVDMILSSSHTNK